MQMDSNVRGQFRGDEAAEPAALQIFLVDKGAMIMKGLAIRLEGYHVN